MEGSISTFSSRWAPFPPLLPLLPSPSPSTIHFSTAPDLPGRVGAQLTHRSEEAIEADEAPHQIRRGIEHWRRRAKCSSSSRRWSRVPDRASRTSPTPSVSPTHPPGAHGHTTAVPPRYASASCHPFSPDRSAPLRCVVLVRRLVRFGRTGSAGRIRGGTNYARYASRVLCCVVLCYVAAYALDFVGVRFVAF